MMEKERKFQLGVILEGEMKTRWEAVKSYYGLEKNADLVRLLVTEKYETLKRQDSLQPRFEQINTDENGVLLHDKKLRKAIHVTFARQGIKCDYHQTDTCEHIAFALGISEVQETIHKRRQEGWKLPEVT